MSYEKLDKETDILVEKLKLSDWIDVIRATIQNTINHYGQIDSIDGYLEEGRAIIKLSTGKDNLFFGIIL